MVRWKEALLAVAVVEAAGALGLGRVRGAPLPFATPVWDSTITSDPNAATIEATIQAAITQISNTFLASGTLTSSNPVALKFVEQTSGLGNSSTYSYQFHYNSGPNNNNYYKALNTSQTSAFDAVSLANNVLNTTNDPATGSTTINVNTPLLRALGFSATTYSTSGNGGLDGTIYLNTSTMNLSRTGTQDSSKWDLYAVTQHEIDEILGLGSGVDASAPESTPQDLFRYASNGTRSFTTAGDNAYFSLTGTTDLAQFNQDGQGDYGDFWSTTKPTFPRVQDAYIYNGVQPNYGIEAVALDVIGYQLASAANLNFNGVNFSSMKLSGTSPTNFTSSTFVSANLTNTTLSGTILTNSNLTSTTCASTFFNSANLTNATLSGAICTNANFSAATLSGALLKNANCASANFTSANLTNATLTGAIMTGTNFTNATYSGAIISAADFRGATNFNATGLTQVNTVLPDGTWNNPTINGTNVVLGTSSTPVKGMGTPLSITNGSYFDIGNNSVILENGTALSTVQTFILSGSTSSRKIRSSAGAANTIGFVSGTEYLAAHGAGSSFAGVAVLSTFVLIMSTKPGDANLDGVISLDDYLQIDTAYVMSMSSPDWFNGNFDGTGNITAADYALIDASFHAQSGGQADGMISLHAAEFGQDYIDALAALGPDAVPEPATLGVLATGALGLLFRRRGRFRSGAP